VLSTRLDEYGAALPHGHLLALDLEHTGAVQDDVHLVILVRLLAVRLRRDENVDTEFQTGRFVDDLIASTGLAQPILDRRDLEMVHSSELT